jgi:hypothetical protein
MTSKSLADGNYDDDTATPPSPRRVNLAAMLAKATDTAPDDDAETGQQDNAGGA